MSINPSSSSSSSSSSSMNQTPDLDLSQLNPFEFAPLLDEQFPASPIESETKEEVSTSRRGVKREREDSFQDTAERTHEIAELQFDIFGNQIGGDVEQPSAEEIENAYKLLENDEAAAKYSEEEEKLCIEYSAYALANRSSQSRLEKLPTELFVYALMEFLNEAEKCALSRTSKGMNILIRSQDRHIWTRFYSPSADDLRLFGSYKRIVQETYEYPILEKFYSALSSNQFEPELGPSSTVQKSHRIRNWLQFNPTFMQTKTLNNHFEGRIDKIPENLTLPTLHKISLQGSFPQLPNWVFTDQLTQLDVSSWKVAHLPNKINECVKLVSLNLNFTRVSALPVGSERLNLARLSWEHAELATIPTVICTFCNLRQLDLRGNRLENFPLEFYQLRKLRQLDLSLNRLTDLPNSFSQFQHLNTLDLTNNGFMQIPNVLWHMNSLTNVSLKNNGIDEMDEELLKFKTQLSFNESLNKTVDSEEALREFCLALPNGKRFVNETMVQMRDIDVFSGTPAELMINWIANDPELQALEELDLSGRLLTSLPTYVSLFNLKKINLKNNPNLVELPDWIYTPKLEELDLSNTGVKRVPQELREYSRLKINLTGTYPIFVPLWFLGKRNFNIIGLNQLPKLEQPKNEEMVLTSVQDDLPRLPDDDFDL